MFLTIQYTSICKIYQTSDHCSVSVLVEQQISSYNWFSSERVRASVTCFTP